MTKIRQVACIVESGDIEMVWVFKKVLTACSALKIKMTVNLIGVNRDAENRCEHRYRELSQVIFNFQGFSDSASSIVCHARC